MVSWRMSSQIWIRTETRSQEAAGGEIPPPGLGWWVERAGSSPAAEAATSLVNPLRVAGVCELLPPFIPPPLDPPSPPPLHPFAPSPS